jgi:hypothetical protein
MSDQPSLHVPTARSGRAGGAGVTGPGKHELKLNTNDHGCHLDCALRSQTGQEVPEWMLGDREVMGEDSAAQVDLPATQGPELLDNSGSGIPGHVGWRMLVHGATHPSCQRPRQEAERSDVFSRRLRRQPDQPACGPSRVVGRAISSRPGSGIPLRCRTRVRSVWLAPASLDSLAPRRHWSRRSSITIGMWRTRTPVAL